MGIFHSTTRLLTSDDEEDNTLTYPVLRNRYIHSEDSSANPLRFTLPSIYKSLKWFLRKVGSILYLAKATDPHPLLPVQNPASTTSTERLFSAECGSVPANFPSPDQSVGVNSTVQEEEEVVSAPDQARCSYASIVVRRLEIVEEIDVRVKSTKEEEEKVRKIKHYSSRHKILLVGEGDFSFSACLAVAFGSATNIIATSLNSKAFLKKNYGSAMSNIEEVRSRGGKVMHGIDATEIAKHELLRQMKFDRIIFNFPFAGFFRKLSPECQLRCHRRLVSLFLKNAKEMLSENGEIHVLHKTNGVHADFNLEGIASSHGLRLTAAVKFKCGNYPGYNPKYGFGGDKNFNPYPSKTFKFGLKLI